MHTSGYTSGALSAQTAGDRADVFWRGMVCYPWNLCHKVAPVVLEHSCMCLWASGGNTRRYLWNTLAGRSFICSIFEHRWSDWPLTYYNCFFASDDLYGGRGEYVCVLSIWGIWCGFYVTHANLLTIVFLPPIKQRHLTSYPYRCTLADFQIEKKIGRGQFSEVYKATCLLDRKPVALKKVQVSILMTKRPFEQLIVFHLWMLKIGSCSSFLRTFLFVEFAMHLIFLVCSIM